MTPSIMVKIVILAWSEIHNCVPWSVLIHQKFSNEKSEGFVCPLPKIHKLVRYGHFDKSTYVHNHINFEILPR